MNIIKKFGFLILFMGILVLPNITNGQSSNLGLISDIITSLNAITGQVSKLENEISNVKKEINNVMGFVGNIALSTQDLSVFITPENVIINRSMSLGSRGKEVKQLQECLKNMGFFPDNQEITEYYGKTTEGAVIKFQEVEGIISLKDDSGKGKFGPKTSASIAKSCAKNTIIAPTGTSSTSTLPIKNPIKYSPASSFSPAFPAPNPLTSTPPDLIPFNLNAASPSSGVWDFAGTIVNIGNSSSNIGQTKLRIDLLSDGTWDILPSNQSTNSIAPRAFEIEQWKNLAITSVGTHKYEVCADDLNTTTESNELNNCTSSSFIIYPPIGTLTASVDSIIPAEQQLLLGSVGVSLGQFKFTANSIEDIRVDTLRITATTSVSSPFTFTNLQFYDGATKIGPIGSPLVATSTSFYMSDFSFGNSMIIPKNVTKTFTLRGDISSYATSPSSHNKFYNFQINSANTSPNLVGDLKGYGITSSFQVPVSAVPTTLQANTQHTLRTKLTPSMSTLGATSNRVRSANDDISKLTLGVNGDTGAEFKSVNFLFSGKAIPNSTTIYVALVDASSGSTLVSTNIKTSIATSSGVNLVLPTPYVISNGLSHDFKLRVDSSNFANGTGSDSLSWQLASTSAILWAAQGNSSIESIGLEARIIPMTNTVSYQ
ncbi:MAG: peptidoglycan-binding protein [Candidatus Pacebacteria bacterium]|nr:peptidoglycan-binding protein [Candidatus Paceibacterota bacterium]